MPKKKPLDQPIVIRLHGYGSFPVLLFNDGQKFMEYVESHNMVEDIIEGHYLEQSVCEVEGMMGALRHEKQEGDDYPLDDEYVFYLLFNQHTIEVVDHEVSHLCIVLFENIGLPISSTTQEAFCYLHDYLLALVCEKLNITKFSPIKY